MIHQGLNTSGTKTNFLQYGVVRFPETGLDDAGHVAFAAKFGELDDVSPYNKHGKKHRLPFEELFDVSNLLEDGSIAPLDSHRAAMNKAGFSPVIDSMRLIQRLRATASSTSTAPSIHGELATAFSKPTNYHPLAPAEQPNTQMQEQPTMIYLRTSSMNSLKTTT